MNKGVFKADNPAGPYTFDNADMAQVVSHVDAISGKSIATDYWDSFIPENTETSPEIIFVSQDESEINAKEAQLIREYSSNNPLIGYNQWPKYKGG